MGRVNVCQVWSQSDAHVNARFRGSLGGDNTTDKKKRKKNRNHMRARRASVRTLTKRPTCDKEGVEMCLLCTKKKRERENTKIAGRKGENKKKNKGTKLAGETNTNRGFLMK